MKRNSGWSPGSFTAPCGSSPRKSPPKIAHHAVAWRDRGVVGFDIAGGEAGSPAGPHRRSFEIAAEGGLGITVHAGEAAGAESVAEAVYRCRANRLGHGTRLYEDPALEDYVRDRRILVEINITSNVQTHAVEAAERHPVRRYADAGLAVSLSSDNWLMSGTTSPMNTGWPTGYWASPARRSIT